MTRDAARAAAQDALRSQGLRSTWQRVLVLSELMARSGDATAQSLYEDLRPDHPTLGLATVYRTLASLVEAGMLHALQHGHGTCYRWCAPGHHHHLTCSGCHRVVEVRDCDVSDWAERVADAHGFSGVRHQLELVGTCPSCAVGHDPGEG